MLSLSRIVNYLWKKESESVEQQNQEHIFEVVDISGSVPIPQKADNIALRDFDNVVVTGMIENEKVQSAKAQVNRRSEKEVPELSKWQEEAYSINISHIAGRLTMVLRGLS